MLIKEITEAPVIDAETMSRLGSDIKSGLSKMASNFGRSDFARAAKRMKLGAKAAFGSKRAQGQLNTRAQVDSIYQSMKQLAGQLGKEKLTYQDVYDALGYFGYDEDSIQKAFLQHSRTKPPKQQSTSGQQTELPLEGKSPHKKGSAKYKKHMAAKHANMNENQVTGSEMEWADIEDILVTATKLTTQKAVKKQPKTIDPKTIDAIDRLSDQEKANVARALATDLAKKGLKVDLARPSAPQAEPSTKQEPSTGSPKKPSWDDMNTEPDFLQGRTPAKTPKPGQ